MPANKTRVTRLRRIAAADTPDALWANGERSLATALNCFTEFLHDDPMSAREDAAALAVRVHMGWDKVSDEIVPTRTELQRARAFIAQFMSDSENR
jgi:hypothetical protein